MSILRKHRLEFLAAGLILLGLLWYAFRPEKLFITQRVNEPSPFAPNGDPQLVYTTKLKDGLHPTTGRASIYKEKDGSLQLRLTNFVTSNGPDVHVVLANNTDAALLAQAPGRSLQSLVELGMLKGNQGDQNYNIQAGTDLNKSDTVVIYCERFRAVFGSGKLQPF